VSKTSGCFHEMGIHSQVIHRGDHLGLAALALCSPLGIATF
jgi:hypothetical protein